MRSKAILFDLGGTLVTAVEEDRSITRTAVENILSLLQSQGCKIRKDQFAALYERQKKIHQDIRDSFHIEIQLENWLWQLLSSACGRVLADKILGEALELLLDARINSVALYPETLRVLEELKGEYRIGIVSNISSSAVAERAAERLGLKRFVDALVTSAEVGVRKPHPGIFSYALRRLDVASRDAMFVGDSIEHDVLGAKSVGLRAIYLDRKRAGTGNYPADLVIHNLEELLSVA